MSGHWWFVFNDVVNMAMEVTTGKTLHGKEADDKFSEVWAAHTIKQEVRS